MSKIMKRHPAAWLFLSSLFGSYIGVHYLYYWGFGVLCSILLFILVCRSKIISILNVLIFIFFISAYLSSYVVLSYQKAISSISANEKNYQGMISEVSRLDGDSKIFLAYVKEEQSSSWLKVLVRINEDLSLLNPLPGQSIHFRGVIKTFTKALSPVHNDALNYAMMRGWHGHITLRNSYECFLGEPLKKPYFAILRMKFIERIIKVLTPYEASILLALIIGDTHLMDKDHQDIYRSIGAQHLLAVSGLQVTLLSWLCFSLLRPLLALCLGSYALYIAALITILVTFAFIGLSGFSSSSIRAFMMMICFLLPLIIKRRINSFDALYVSGLITILSMPLVILDVGFLLSYAAVLGLLIGYQYRDVVLNLAKRIYCPSFLALALLASIFASLFTLPIILIYFGQIAPFSILANFLLVPISSCLQIIAILLGLMGVLCNAPYLLNIAAINANIIDIIAQELKEIFGLLIYPQNFSLFFVFIFVLINIVFIFTKKWRFILCLNMIIIAFYLYNFTKEKPLTVSVLAVGQGDATLFSTPNNKHILIDAGGQVWGDFDPGFSIVLPSLRRRGIKELEVVIITHPDPDHILGIFAVLENIKVKAIWHNGYKEGHPLLNNMLKLAHEKKIKVLSTPSLLGKHDIDDVSFSVLAPNTKSHESYFPKLSSNDNSMVILINYGDFTLLWPADIEKAGEEKLLANSKDIKVDIVKAPHHGSKTSSSLDLVKKTSPKHVIYSTGLYNRFNFPHDEVKNRWQNIEAKQWNTADDGEISIKIFAHHLQIEGFKSKEKASLLRKKDMDHE